MSNPDYVVRAFTVMGKPRPRLSRHRAVLVLAAIFFLNFVIPGQDTENQPPFVSGGISLGPSRMTLMAFPSDPDGTIDRVEYFEGSQLLGSIHAPPYHLTLRLLNTAPISLNFTLVAVDNRGARSVPYPTATSGGGGSVPTDLPVKSGLQLWLRADVGVTTNSSGGVIAWQDQSDGGHHAGPLSAPYQPTGLEAPESISEGGDRRPRVRFDGQDDVLEIPNSSSLRPGLDNWTVFWTGQSLISTGDGATIVGSRLGGGEADEGWAVAWENSGRLASHFADGVSGHGFSQAQSVSSAWADAQQIWQIEEDRESQTTRFFFNGSSDAEGATAMPAGPVNPTGPIHLGRDFSGDHDRSAAMDLAELIIFNRTLDGAEREAVTAYLADRHKIAALVITNRPPTVVLSAPARGVELPFRQPATLFASASDGDGGVTLVEFFADGRSLGVVSRTPFRLTTTNLPAGELILSARATDNQGAVTISAPIPVTVVVPLNLSFAVEGDEFALIWDGPATLATAETLVGEWTAIPEATSPYRVPLAGAERLFRLQPPTGIGDPTTGDYGYDPTALEDIPLAILTDSSAPPISAMVSTNFLPPVGQQGTTNAPGSPGSCAAWASTYGLATFTAAKRGNYSPAHESQWASPAYFYVKVLEQNGLASNSCSGSQMTSYFHRLAAGGAPSMQTAPYVASCTHLWNDYGGKTIPSESVFGVTNIAAVATTNLTAIKRIITSNRVLSYGTRLYTQWGAYRGEVVPYVGTGVIAKQPNGKPVGHCMLIIGYDDTKGALLIQNSEGSNWGGTIDGSPPNAERTNAGYIWMAYETFTALAQGKAFFHVESP